VCSALAATGAEVVLTALKAESNISVEEYYGIKQNFKIFILNKKTKKNLKQIKELINSFQPDFVYGRYLHGCTVAAYLKQRVFFEAHALNMSNTLKSKISFYLLIKSKYLKKIIAITRVLAKDIKAKHGIEQCRIAVLPDGADKVDRSKVAPAKLEGNYKYNLGYTGSMHPGKGVELIIHLSKDNPEIGFHIVGGNERTVKQFIESFQNENLKFYGHQPHSVIDSYISSFDVCLLPNSNNVFINNSIKGNIGKYTSPLKLFEYMSHGKAIISSDLPVIREILDENNSVLVPHDDIAKWQDAILKLKDSTLRKQMGENALRDFEKYTWENRAKTIIELNENADK